MHSAFLVRGQLAHALAGRIVDADRDISTLRQGVAQEIRDDRAERRVRGRVFAIAGSARAAASSGNGTVRVVLRRGFYREEVGTDPVCLADLLKWRDVVDDVDAAAVRADDEIVLAGVNHDVVDRYGRDVVFELSPEMSLRGREEHPELRADEEKVRLDEIFAYHLHRSVRGEIAADRSPVHAVVVALENIRLEIIVAVVVERGVDRPFAESGRDDATHISVVRDSRELRDSVPRPSAIA